MILQAAVRLYANNVRLIASRKKYRKCNVASEMQQTHDAAFISTHLRNAVPHIYVGLRFCKKSYKLNWNAEDSMRRKIGSNAILQEILKMQLVTGDVDGKKHIHMMGKQFLIPELKN